MAKRKKTTPIVLNIDPQIADFDHEIALLKEREREAKGALDMVVHRRWTVVTSRVNKALDMRYTTRDLVGGHYDCPKSPTGNCIYDGFEDLSMDECLFCGQPDERK